MKYVIMCGGDYPQFETPKQLTWLGTEYIVQRTIRLLREAGVEDITISTNKRATFEKFGVPIINQTEYDRGIWLYQANMLSRCIAWELWQVIKGTQLNNIIVNYTVVNDFTCDCDSAHDLTDIKDRLLYYGMKLEDV